MQHVTVELRWWGELIAVEEVEVGARPRRVEQVDGVPLLAPVVLTDRDGVAIERPGEAVPFTHVAVKESAPTPHPGRPPLAWRQSLLPTLLSALLHSCLATMVVWGSVVATHPGTGGGAARKPVDLDRLAHGDERIVPLRGAFHGEAPSPTPLEPPAPEPSTRARASRVAHGGRHREGGVVDRSAVLGGLAALIDGGRGTSFSAGDESGVAGDEGLPGLFAIAATGAEPASAGRLVPIARGVPDGELGGLRPTRTPGVLEGRCISGDHCRYVFGTGTSTSTTGSLSREAVQRVMRRLHGAILSCASAGLDTGVEDARIEVDFVIGADGRTSAVTVASEAMPDARGCVARVIERSTFPPTPGVTGVHYPYVLTIE